MELNNPKTRQEVQNIVSDYLSNLARSGPVYHHTVSVNSETNEIIVSVPVWEEYISISATVRAQ